MVVYNAPTLDGSALIPCCLACDTLMLATLHPGGRNVQES